MDRSPTLVTLAANFTADAIEPTIRYLLTLLQIPHRVSIAGYNQILPQLIDPSSSFARNRGGMNVVLLRLGDLGSRTEVGRNPEAVWNAAHEFADCAVTYAQRKEMPPLLVVICPEPRSILTDALYTRAVTEVEAAIALDLRTAGAQVITSSEIVDTYPVQEWDDSLGNELGHIPYTDDAFAAIGAMIARKIRAFAEVPYKVLALDADNTLWTGVVAEEGADGIILDEGRIALQRFVIQQQEAGMLLCMCSKNLAPDVDVVFARRKMPLEPRHFVASRLNWRPKSENLRALADSLSLNLDSFVFVDDSLVECAEVSAQCPQVLTIHLPQDSAAATDLLRRVWAFDRWTITDEDRRRSEAYRQDLERRKVQPAGRRTMSDFISSLGLEIRIEAPATADLARVAQLTYRTNQFNFTTLRRSEAEIINSGLESLKVNVRDRFGDYGLVGAMLFAVNDGELEIDSFLLSCRVLGRGVEHAMLAHVGAIAKQRQLTGIKIPLTVTARNLPAQDFLLSIGQPWVQLRDGGFDVRLPVDEAVKVVYTPDAPAVSNSRANAPEETAAVDNNELPEFRSSEAAGRNNAMERLAAELGTASAIRRCVDEALKTKVHIPVTGSLVAARTQGEKTLVAICEKVLGIAPIGVNHDLFLELGADSFSAVRIAASIRSNIGYPAEVATVQEARTIERLALAISSPSSDRSAEKSAGALLTAKGPSSSVYALRSQGNKLPLFLVRPSGASAGSLAYVALARHLDLERPVYVFQNRPLLEQASPYGSIREMAEEYLSEMRAIQPRGPYLLGGWCLGGKTAFEMANCLCSTGDRVDLLVLFDSFPPTDQQGQAEFLQRRAMAVQKLRAFARYPWASNIITREKSLMARFKLIPYIDHENNDVNLVANAFPNCFDATALRRLPAEAMWEYVYQTLKAAEPADMAADIESAASVRRASMYFACDHQLDALYTPTQRYPGEITIFAVRGTRSRAERWAQFLTTSPDIHELDIKPTAYEPDPHNAMMIDDNAALVAAELNKLLDSKTQTHEAAGSSY